MSPQQKAAQTRSWNRALAKCEPNDREELIAFREFLQDRNMFGGDMFKTDREAWFARWGEYCNVSRDELGLPPLP